MQKEFAYLFRTSTEGNVESDDSLCSVVHVHGLTKLSIEEGLQVSTVVVTASKKGEQFYCNEIFN